MRFVAIPLSLLVFSAQLVLGDETSPRTVAVVVTDSKGTRIHGLSAADFQLLENGQPKAIRRFSESTPENGAEVRRSVVILIDSSTLSIGGRRKSIAALRAAVPALIRPQDRVAVATITPQGGMLEAAGWTNDLSALAKALDRIESESLTPGFTSAERAEQEIRQLINDDRLAADASQITFETLLLPARQYAEFVMLQAKHILDGVSDAVVHSGTGPGRKAVLLVGSGLPARPGADIFQFLENLRGQVLTGNPGAGIKRGAATASPMSELARYDMTSHIRDAGRAAFRRGVVIYSIDGEGWHGDTTIERTGTRDLAMEGTTAIEKLAGYQLLSNNSGGVALSGGSATDAVALIGTDLQSHYALTFDQVPSATVVPRLEVKAKPGYHTRIWFEGGAATKESLIEDAVLANHRGVVASNDLQIALASDPPISEGLDRRVKVKVYIPVKSLTLTRDGGDYIGGFDVYVSTGDATGNASPVSRQKYQIRWPAAQIEQMREKTIGYLVDVVMRPGRTQVSIGVVDQQSQHTGFARTTIGG